MRVLDMVRDPVSGRWSLGTGVVVGGMSLSLPGLAQAATTTAPDFSTLTSSIDFSTAITAIMAAGAALIVVAIARYGVRAVISMFRGA
jgi:hypothetical protein